MGGRRETVVADTLHVVTRINDQTSRRGVQPYPFPILAIERLQAFLRDMAEPAIIVTHGTTSIVLRGLCMGLSQPEILKLPRDQGCVFFLSAGEETILR